MLLCGALAAMTAYAGSFLVLQLIFFMQCLQVQWLLGLRGTCQPLSPAVGCVGIFDTQQLLCDCRQHHNGNGCQKAQQCQWSSCCSQ